MTMDPAVKTRWVKALRSGTYKQTTEVLRRIDAFDTPLYCCLGVLAAIECPNPAERFDHTWSDGFDEDDTFWFDDTYDESILPVAFRNKVGLHKNEQTRLTEMNDEENADFATIATWIEANL